jgi:hypothetical protein
MPRKALATSSSSAVSPWARCPLQPRQARACKHNDLRRRTARTLIAQLQVPRAAAAIQIVKPTNGQRQPWQEYGQVEDPPGDRRTDHVRIDYESCDITDSREQEPVPAFPAPYPRNSRNLKNPVGLPHPAASV